MMSSIIEVLAAILPVIGMIGVGVFLRKTQWISRKGIDDIKFLVSRIMLTVAVFHALATAYYNSKIAVLVCVLLIVELITFGIGFLIRPLFPADRARYIPFLMSLYEGGMVAYPLYSNLCGAAALSKIALLDYVNEFLEKEKNSGRIDELADEYIYRYIEEVQDDAA